MTTDAFKPGFFVLGAAKCGTNTLHQYFDRMPDVCVPWPKESSFFSHHFDKGMDYYRRTYFGHWKGRQCIGDMSVFNLYCPDAPLRIHQLAPDARLIVMVRNPIERAHADWHFQSQRNRETRSFEQAIEQEMSQRDQVWDVSGEDKKRRYLDSGHYHEQVERYLQLFSRQQLKIILIDDLIARPGEVVSDVVSFLNLDPARNRFEAAIHVNKAGGLVNKKTLRYRGWRLFRSLHKRRMLAGPIWHWANDRLVPRTQGARKPVLCDDTRQLLGQYYQPGIESLSEFLGRDLSHWK